MKKLMLLTLLIPLLFACGSEKGGEPYIPPVNPPQTDTKKQIMFQIDEGMNGELIMHFKDDLHALDAALENICDAISPLQAKYTVSVNIYPTWLYKESGYGSGSAAVGVNRLDPALLHVFDYLKSKNIGVYLELYSSGIYTSQNGEVGNQPLVRERYGKQKIVKGIPLDLDCLEDVFEKYDIVKGVRFHELIGTHEIGLNGNPHGFTVDFDFLTEVAEVCKKHDRRLVWGDHSWFLAYTEPGKYGMWLDHLRKTCETLGDNITVNYSNNGWGGQQYSLQYTYNMADFCNNNRWGYSAQSWWWQEKDAQALPKWENGDTRWYGDAYFDMPAELMAAFTLETFRRGGDLVQYEPAVYAFNFYHPGSKAEDRIGQYEQAPDYSARMTTKRLVDILLRYDTDRNAFPSMNPADYYASSQSEMMGNSWREKPKTYNQTTITALGDRVKVFDTYCSNPGTWYNNDADRYLGHVFSGNVVDAVRAKTDFRLIDEVLVIKKAGNLQAAFYNHMSAYYVNCDNLVASNSDGEFAGLVSLNLKRNYPGRNDTFFGDPDEIVVARTNGQQVRFTVYEKTYENNGATRRNFKYTVDNTLTAQVNAQLGNVAATDFIALLGMRSRNFLYPDNTRPEDNLLLATRTPAGKVLVSGEIRGEVANIPISKTLDTDASSIRDIKCADTDLNYVDELAVLKNDGTVDFFECKMNAGYDFVRQSNLQGLGSNVRKILATRWTTYYKE